MAGSEGKSRRKRRTVDEWRELLSGFGSSGLSVAAFCANAAISAASFHRWRKLIAHGVAPEVRREAPGFVDLGTLAVASPVATATQASGRLELTLDLGGGVVLHLVRG